MLGLEVSLPQLTLGGYNNRGASIKKKQKKMKETKTREEMKELKNARSRRHYTATWQVRPRVDEFTENVHESTSGK